MFLVMDDLTYLMLFKVHLLDKGKETILSESELDMLFDRLCRSDFLTWDDEQPSPYGINDYGFGLVPFSEDKLYLYVEFSPWSDESDELELYDGSFLTAPENNKLCKLDDLRRRWFYDEVELFDNDTDRVRALEFFCTVFPLSEELSYELLKQYRTSTLRLASECSIRL